MSGVSGAGPTLRPGPHTVRLRLWSTGTGTRTGHADHPLTWQGGAEIGLCGVLVVAGVLGARSDRLSGLGQLLGEQIGEPGDLGDVSEVPGSGVDGLAQPGVDALGADLLGDPQGLFGQQRGLFGFALDRKSVV